MIFYIIMALLSILLGIMVAFFAKKRYQAIGSVIIVLGLVAMYPVAYTDTLSRARSVNDQIYHVEKSEILAYHIQYGNTIYYLLADPETGEPRFFREAWQEGSKERAQQLQDPGNQGGTMMYDPGQENGDQIGNYQPKVPDEKEAPVESRGVDHVFN